MLIRWQPTATVTVSENGYLASSVMGGYQSTTTNYSEKFRNYKLIYTEFYADKDASTDIKLYNIIYLCTPSTSDLARIGDYAIERNKVIGMLIDIENKKVQIFRNNVLYSETSVNFDGDYRLYFQLLVAHSCTCYINSGQKPFVYPKSGAVSLQDYYTFAQKMLVFSNGEYKKYDGANWQTVTSSAPTEQDYLNGMDIETMTLNTNILRKLNDFKPKLYFYADDLNQQTATLDIKANYCPLDELKDPELLLWTDDTNATYQLKNSAAPKPKLVIPLKDTKILGTLQNFNISSTENGTNIIPKMTSNTTPSPYVVSASSIWDATYDAWKAFNGTNTDATDCWATANNVRTGWIMVDFNTPKVISQYTITSRTGASVTETPKKWTFEGSNNNADWIILDTKTNEINWALNQKRAYQFMNITPYRYYRLNIAENNGNVILSIGEIEMMESKIKIICSNDSGLTWQSYKSSWQIVDSKNLTNVKNNGMTCAELNAIPKNQWQEFCSKGIIRFAYYLEQSSYLEQVVISGLSSTQNLTIDTPTLNSLTIIYDELDKKYSGLMFMDTSQKYYSTSIGEILKYLDMGTMIAGQTSLDIQVKLTNTYPFDVKNIRLWPEHNISGLTIEMSKTNQPFVGQPKLTFDQLLFDQVVDFYIRLTVDPSAQSGGTFDIRVHAEPV